MKRPNPRLFVTNVFVLFALAPVVRAQPLSLPQLEAKWRALELAERSGIRYAVEHTYSIGGRMRPTFNWAVESSPGNGKAARGRDQVLVWNNQYTFALVTKEGSAEFLLNGLTVGPPGVENDTYSLFIKMNSMHGHIIHPYTYLNDDTAAEMLSSGRLTIDTVNLPDTDGRIGLHGWTEFSQRVGPKVRSEFTAVIDAADGRGARRAVVECDAAAERL